MNRDIAKGKVEQVKGKAREEVGKITGDKSEQVKGKVEQVGGKMQENLGKVKKDINKKTR
jgi:uncharacterized protein YjbJ (UPF0337 family)